MKSTFWAALAGLGIALVLISMQGCAHIKSLNYADYLCEPACEELQTITLERCDNLCTNALAGDEAAAYIPACDGVCRDLVQIGKTECVEVCQEGVTEALMRADAVR